MNYQNFPFAFSKLININNKAYIIGGILYEESQQKSQYVVQLNHINDYGNIKMNGYIETNLMPKTIYKHVSTQLIYSNLYHTLFVLSGDNQFNCEYNILSACQTKLTKWRKMAPLKNYRTNCIHLLLNEQYIYLIGGIIEKKKKFMNMMLLIFPKYSKTRM